MMNIGTTRNTVQFSVKVTEKGYIWRNFPRHLAADKYAAFVEAFRKVLTEDTKGKTVVSNIMSLVGIYAIAAGYGFNKDVSLNPFLKALIAEIECYWDFNYNENYIGLYRARTKTAFISLLNQIDCGYCYKSISGKHLDNILRGKLTSINKSSGNTRGNKPTRNQIIKQICLEVYSITAFKTEKRYSPVIEE